MEMAKVEAPSIALAAAVLAHQAVEPAVEAARQIEISAVDREHERVVKNGLVEPVRHDQLDALRPAVAIGALLPFVDPREAMAAAFRRLADRCRNGRRLQPVERRLQALVVAQRRAAPDIGENFVGRGGHQPRGAKPGIPRLDDLARRPDQDVGVPDCRHAMIGHGLDADRHVAGDEIDRRNAMGFGEREERIGHEILRVS
ncbi:MAG: hypothetical protein OJF48_004867 [Afipia sp.]|jgi:hypothetical protein|nr:MAG: hypothetical protein OJF48_004867 [Afipia sp.]